MSDLDVCIFCLRCRGNLVGVETCSYGLRHEFPEPVQSTVEIPKRVDKQLCVKCGVHRKNPKSATSGCDHEYPPAV